MPEQLKEDTGVLSGTPSSAGPQIEKVGLLRALRRQVWAAWGYFRFISGLIRSYSYDIRRYYASVSKGHEAVLAGKSGQVELRSWIMADAHKIEKGLALGAPRPGFGKAIIHRLLDQLGRYQRDFGPDHATEVAISTLLSYCKFNEESGEADAPLRAWVESLALPLASDSCGELGGVIPIERDRIVAQAKLPGLFDFFHSRYSIRCFTGEPVSEESVAQAVSMAQKTPSVCNRQSWKAYAFLDTDVAHQVLDCQSGNRGFRDTVGGVLVVTSDLRTFFSYGERNQGFIDGGMFAMSVVYGLHAQGLGTCCLNWCVEISAERRLRALTNIPDYEAVIMMIAVGQLPEKLGVAQSARKPLDEVLIHGRLRNAGPQEND